MTNPHQHQRPQRIVRSRRKGTPLPEGAAYVGRPTIWGNPFQDRGMNHARSVIIHKNWLAGRIGALSLERMRFSPAEIEALRRLRDAIRWPDSYHAPVERDDESEDHVLVALQVRIPVADLEACREEALRQLDAETAAAEADEEGADA